MNDTPPIPAVPALTDEQQDEALHAIAELSKAPERLAMPAPVGSLKSERIQNGPAGRCRCSHSFAEHALDACRSCAEDGLSILHQHPFIAR